MSIQSYNLYREIQQHATQQLREYNAGMVSGESAWIMIPLDEQDHTSLFARMIVLDKQEYTQWNTNHEIQFIHDLIDSLSILKEPGKTQDAPPFGSFQVNSSLWNRLQENILEPNQLVFPFDLGDGTTLQCVIPFDGISDASKIYDVMSLFMR